MTSILEFYNAMLPHAERALQMLDASDLRSLRPDESTLLRLLLSLASCAMAVEVHQAPRAKFSPFPHGVRVLRGADPFG
jgi:hypothetical protein